MEEMIEETRVSSAKRDAKDTTRFVSRSLIMIIKRIGPRTVPWGTPDSTGEGVEIAPFAETCCVLLERNVWSQTPTLPPIRAAFSFLQRMAWSTLSKALAKSRYIVSTSLPDSRTLVMVSTWLIS